VASSFADFPSLGGALLLVGALDAVQALVHGADGLLDDLFVFRSASFDRLARGIAPLFRSTVFCRGFSTPTTESDGGGILWRH
jgi:hypothetical protein